MKVAWLVWVMEVVQMEVLSEEKMATVAREAEEMVQAMVEVVMAAEPKVVVSMGVAAGFCTHSPHPPSWQARRR